jgi:hypothetical protein
MDKVFVVCRHFRHLCVAGLPSLSESGAAHGPVLPAAQLSGLALVNRGRLQGDGRLQSFLRCQSPGLRRLPLCHS